jgi:hypothetical protein
MNIAESSDCETSSAQFRSFGGTSFSASSARPTAETRPRSGFAICAIIAAEQIEKGQQLWPAKLGLAETASVALEPSLEDLQANVSERQEHDFVDRLDSKRPLQMSVGLISEAIWSAARRQNAGSRLSSSFVRPGSFSP